MPRRYGDSAEAVTVPGKDIGLTLQLQKLPVQVECETFEPEFDPLTWENGETDRVFVLGGWLVADWEENPFPLMAVVKGQWPKETVFTWTWDWEVPSPEDDFANPVIHIRSHLNSLTVFPPLSTELGYSSNDGILTASVKAKTPTKTVSLGPITMTVVKSDC